MEEQVRRLPLDKLRKLPARLSSLEAHMAAWSTSKLQQLVASQLSCETAIQQIETAVEGMRSIYAPAEVESIVKVHSELLDAHNASAGTHCDRLSSMAKTVTNMQLEMTLAKQAIAQLSNPVAEAPAGGIMELLEEVKQIRHGLEVVQMQAQSSDARTRVALAVASRQQAMSPGQYANGTIPWGNVLIHPPVNPSSRIPDGAGSGHLGLVLGSTLLTWHSPTTEPPHVHSTCEVQWAAAVCVHCSIITAFAGHGAGLPWSHVGT